MRRVAQGMGRGWEGVCVGMVGMRVVEADVAVGLAGGVSVCHGERVAAGEDVDEDVRRRTGGGKHVERKPRDMLRGRKESGSDWGRASIYGCGREIRAHRAKKTIKDRSSLGWAPAIEHTCTTHPYPETRHQIQISCQAPTPATTHRHHHRTHHPQTPARASAISDLGPLPRAHGSRHGVHILHRSSSQPAGAPAVASQRTAPCRTRSHSLLGTAPSLILLSRLRSSRRLTCSS